MKAHCGYCGEEIMGAVNRCWRCGHHFAVSPAADGLPPVRRDPIPAPTGGSLEPSRTTVVGRALPVSVRPQSPASPIETHAQPAIASQTAQSSDEAAAGRLLRLETANAKRWGTPFSSDFEPTAGDRWRRRQRRLREWLRLVVGDPPSVAGAGKFVDRPTPWAASSLGGASRGGIARASPLDTPPHSPLANAAAFLSLALSAIALAVLPYPLIALAMAGMALSLATLSQWATPRARTIALIVLALAILATAIWKTTPRDSSAGGVDALESSGTP
ncbi:MAG: hypothetical protein RLY70_3380 [Planctomycetota bacterium]